MVLGPGQDPTNVGAGEERVGGGGRKGGGLWHCALHTQASPLFMNKPIASWRTRRKHCRLFSGVGLTPLSLRQGVENTEGWA